MGLQHMNVQLLPHVFPAPHRCSLFSYHSTLTTRGLKSELTELKQGQITAMRWAKLPISQIAEQLKRTRDCISRHLSSPTTYRVQNGAKLKSKLSPTDLKTIKREVRARRMSARKIKVSNKLTVFVRQLQLILSSDPTLKSLKPKRNSILTKRHKISRPIWGTESRAWSQTQWGKVIFFDKKKCNLNGLDEHTSY